MKDSDLEFDFPVPRGSGLGTSSAMNVAVAALNSSGQLEDSGEIAEQAFLSESKENRCGRQDHWASTFGGFNHLLFIGDSVERMPFEPMKSSLNWLKKHLLIAYSGNSRNSGKIQESVWSSYSNGDEGVIQGLHKIRSSAREMANGLQQDRRDLVVSSLRGVCEGVDMIDPTIHDPFRGVVMPLIESGSIVAWKALGSRWRGVLSFALLTYRQGICHSVHRGRGLANSGLGLRRARSTGYWMNFVVLNLKHDHLSGHLWPDAARCSCPWLYWS